MNTLFLCRFLQWLQSKRRAKLFILKIGKKTKRNVVFKILNWLVWRNHEKKNKKKTDWCTHLGKPSFEIGHQVWNCQCIWCLFFFFLIGERFLLFCVWYLPPSTDALCKTYQQINLYEILIIDFLFPFVVGFLIFHIFFVFDILTIARDTIYSICNQWRFVGPKADIILWPSTKKATNSDKTLNLSISKKYSGYCVFEPDFWLVFFSHPLSKCNPWQLSHLPQS